MEVLKNQEIAFRRNRYRGGDPLSRVLGVVLGILLAANIVNQVIHFIGKSLID
jgi:hypothetical protein